MENGCIIIKNVSKSFEDKKVLDDINLEIGYGEIFGLLGPSGAGKTTMIKIITDQLKPESGTVFVQGEDNNQLNKVTRAKWGMVLDNMGIYKRLSCYDNLKICADIYQIKKQRVEEVLQDVGLYEYRKVQADNLSKGMKQRLSIARALLHSPSILFLDEPTTGLDPFNAKAIRKLITAERDKGKTIFLSTHNMVEATEMCSNIALLNDGHIIEYGAPLDICRKYDTQRQMNVITKDGRELWMDFTEVCAEQILSLIKEDNILTIHSSEPTLESIFLKLTGKELDD